LLLIVFFIESATTSLQFMYLPWLWRRIFTPSPAPAAVAVLATPPADPEELQSERFYSHGRDGF
jgi:hypothetical protein